MIVHGERCSWLILAKESILFLLGRELDDGGAAPFDGGT